MLEMFFDNEKVFSVFEEILKSGSEEVNMAKLLYKMNIPVDDAADILQSFVFLGILEETEETETEGIFKFNATSRIVLAICVFDDIVGQHFVEKMKEKINDGEGLFSLLNEEKENDGNQVFSSMKDFENFLKENGLL